MKRKENMGQRLLRTKNDRGRIHKRGKEEKKIEGSNKMEKLLKEIIHINKRKFN
jgi:hypothetical protein